MVIDYTRFSTELYTAEIAEHGILVVTLVKPKQLNSVRREFHSKLDQLWTAFENDANMRAAILTGKGKVFSAGADLKEWLEAEKSNGPEDDDPNKIMLDTGGFLGISNRTTRKPIIIALNGPAYGGGTEALLNADLAVAVVSATISLPEVRKGVLALAGALPRAGRLLGIKRANELALIGKSITAQTAYEWGIINRIVNTPEEVLPAAIQLARSIIKASPDAVMATLQMIRRGYEDTKLTLIEATKNGADLEYVKVKNAPNMKEGLESFRRRDDPKWQEYKL